MVSIWRRSAIAAGVALLLTGLSLPAITSNPAGAAIGPVETTTSVVPYSCRGVGFAALIGTLPTQDVTMTLGAPTTVTPGQPYTMTLDITPLTLADAGFPIVAPAFTTMNPVGGTGSDSGRAKSPDVSFAGPVATVPRSLMTVTPTAGPGGQVVLTASRIRIVVGSTGFECDPTAGAARATIATQVIAETTTTTTTSTTSSTVPGETTSSTASTTSTSTTTTVPVTAPPPTTAPTTTVRPPTTAPPTTSRPQPTTPPPVPPPPGTPAGPAVTVRSSGSATFTCNIFDSTGRQFNQNPLPPSPVTLTLTLPDKVGVGGQVSGLVRFDPGPLNGPIRLPAGSASFAATVTMQGGQPGSVVATGGPNAAEISPNSASRSPEMPFSFTAASPAGSDVRVGVSQVEVRATSPTTLTTRCTPQGNGVDVIAGVAVVEGTVAPPSDLTAEVANVSTGSGSGSGSGGTGSGSASDGFANCEEAKAAGRGTIVRTDPAYRPSLDADGDGLACERDEVLAASLASTGTTSAAVLAWSFLLGASGAGLILLGRSASRRRARAG